MEWEREKPVQSETEWQRRNCSQLAETNLSKSFAVGKQRNETACEKKFRVPFSRCVIWSRFSNLVPVSSFVTWRI